jgi:nucleoside-diphosphate-sugar epimerase
MLLAAERVGIRRFVYASSQSVLGFAYATRVIPPDWLPVDETHPCRPVEGYGLSKRVGEQLCEMVSARSAMTTVVLRFPVIWSHERFEAHTRKRLDDPVQAAKSQWAYVDLRDAAAGCRLASEVLVAHRHSVYNIGAYWPFELVDAAATLRASYGDVAGLDAVAASGKTLFDISRAAADLGFRAIWRWSRDGIKNAHVASK